MPTNYNYTPFYIEQNALADALLRLGEHWTEKLIKGK